MAEPKEPYQDVIITAPVGEVEPKPPKRSLVPSVIVRVLKRFSLGYPKNRDRDGWASAEYDLAEVDRAENTESMLKLSINKYTEQILNCGWHLSGENVKTRAYVKKRLLEFGLVSGQAWELTLQEVIRNLVKYNNAFLYFRRSSEFSSGAPIRLYGRRVDPIAGVWPIDPTSMIPRVDRYNNVTQWKQETEPFSGFAEVGDEQYTTEKTYGREDILHIFRNRTTGFVLGTPDYIPVFDDIRDLRMFEDQVNLLVHAHTFPLYHIRVGTKDAPAGKTASGDDEVEYVRREFEKLESDGSFVTNERVEVNVVGSERYGGGLDVVRLLEQYRSRVQRGVYLSDIDVGQGDSANRSTARQLSYGFQERCKDFQRIVEHFLTNTFFSQLLLEGGYDLTPDNIVEFKFNEIDLEARLSIGNHAMALYQGHMITHEEARLMSGLRPLEEKQKKDMFFENIAKKLALIQAVDESSGLGSKSSTTNRNQPSNQSGTKMAKTQPKNDAEQRGINYLEEELLAVASNLVMSGASAEEILDGLVAVTTDVFAPVIADGVHAVSPEMFAGKNMVSGFSKLLRSRLKKLFDGMSDMIDAADSTLDRSIISEVLSEDLVRISSDWMDMAYAYGSLRAEIHTGKRDSQELYSTTYSSLRKLLEKNS